MILVITLDHPDHLFPDRGQSHGLCELQRLGGSCVHTGGVCLQNAGWNDVCRGRRVHRELCGCLYDALWGGQPERGDVSVGALGRRWCCEYISVQLIHMFSKIKPFKDIDWKESAASKDRFYRRPVSVIVFSFIGKLLHSVGCFRVRRWLSYAPRCLTSQCLESPRVSNTPPSGTLWLTSSTETSITCKKSKSKSGFSGDLFACRTVWPVRWIICSKSPIW